MLRCCDLLRILLTKFGEHRCNVLPHTRKQTSFAHPGFPKVVRLEKFKTFQASSRVHSLVGKAEEQSVARTGAPHDQQDWREPLQQRLTAHDRAHSFEG